MSRRAISLAGVLLVAVSLTALGGCSIVGSPLEGTQWRLTGWSVSSLDPADFTITARFADGEISGNSGVNSYGGPYTIGPGAAFSTGQLAGTLMASEEPAMRAESAYLALLGQAGSYKMADGKLTLFDKGGNVSLIFEAAGK
jgi:heat shock protein HslJ